MRVFFVHEDIYNAGNPYIYSLAEGIKQNHNDFEFSYGLCKFWGDDIFTYDIVHFQWPQAFIEGDPIHTPKDLANRISEIRAHGIKIFATCHDIRPHYQQCNRSAEALDIVYRSSDVIIHLGEYSKRIFESQYSQTVNIVIPHHIYDKVYSFFPERKYACQKLGLKESKKYILCFGTFRAQEERDLAKMVIRNFRQKGYLLLAPGYIDINAEIKMMSNIPFLKNILRCIIRKSYFIKYRIQGIIIKGKTWNAVSDNELPYYYGAADICLLQRKQILNSGNLFLPMLFDKIVIGPNTGNVGLVLEQIEYPVFDINSDNSIIDAVNRGIKMATCGIAHKRHKEFLSYFSTEIISEKLFNVYYESIVNSS